MGTLKNVMQRAICTQLQHSEDKKQKKTKNLEWVCNPHSTWEIWVWDVLTVQLWGWCGNNMTHGPTSHLLHSVLFVNLVLDIYIQHYSCCRSAISSSQFLEFINYIWKAGRSPNSSIYLEGCFIASKLTAIYIALSQLISAPKVDKTLIYNLKNYKRSKFKKWSYLIITNILFR